MHSNSSGRRARSVSRATEPRDLSDFIQAAYGELRRMAEVCFKSERPGHTLQPTALVHEAFLRLERSGPRRYVNRAHFFGVAAKTMRRILVERARRRNTNKRGRGWQRIPLEDVTAAAAEVPDYVAIDAALSRLARIDPRSARLMELRLFTGVTAREAAGLLHIGESTVRKKWAIAGAWLRRDLNSHLHPN